MRAGTRWSPTTSTCSAGRAHPIIRSDAERSAQRWSPSPSTVETDATTIRVEDDGGGSTVQFFIEVGGQLQPLPLSPEVPVDTDAISGDGTYVCTSTTLTVTIDEPEGLFTVVWDRIGRT